MTASYTAGTVSVTAGSDIVTGSGTGWLASNISPGYFGVDSSNGNPVPVLEVLSDTSMRLVKPWRGSSASGQAYWLSYDTRDGQQTVNNAQRLAEYIALLRSSFFTAFSGLNPEADKIPYFGSGAAAALASITAAGRGLLGQSGATDTAPYYSSASGVARTALTAKGRRLIGSSTVQDLLNELGPVFGGPAPIPSGASVGMVEGDFNTIIFPGVYTISGEWVNGSTSQASATYTGVLEVLARAFNNQYVQILRLGGAQHRVYRRSAGTGAADWSPWQLIESPTVGTVSVSGGEPRGSVIERGANSNGEYVRFADGTQICWNANIANGSVPCNEVSGSIFRSAIINWTFPVSFAAAATMTGSVSAGATPLWANSNFTSTTVTSSRLFSATSSSAGTTLGGIAIGRWFN